jgi:hypothetical protein
MGGVRPNTRENGQITPRPPFGLPEVPVAVRTSCLSSREAGKALIFTPVRESSGESRLNTSGHTLAPSGDSEKAANEQRCP